MPEKFDIRCAVLDGHTFLRGTDLLEFLAHENVPSVTLAELVRVMRQAQRQDAA